MNKSIRIDAAALERWKLASGIELNDGEAANAAVRTAASLRQIQAEAMAGGIEWILHALRAGHIPSTDVKVTVEGAEVRVAEVGGHVVAVFAPNPLVRAP